jgi:pentapeptide repeat protein
VALRTVPRVARATRSKPRKTRPDPPDVPSGRDPAPAAVGSDDTWDGVLAGADVEVPEHVAGLSLQECRWEGADLAGRTFGGLRCRDTEFVHCDLSGAVLDDASLTRVTFTDCRLTGVVLAGASLIDVRIADCRADMANFRMARGRHLLVEGTGLQGADFYRFTGKECWLLGCDLTGANFADAELGGTHLNGSTLDDVRGAFSLRGSRISADQQVPLGIALLGALDIGVAEPPA